jgi:hypothetical protein
MLNMIDLPVIPIVVSVGLTIVTIVPAASPTVSGGNPAVSAVPDVGVVLPEPPDAREPTVGDPEVDLEVGLLIALTVPFANSVVPDVRFALPVIKTVPIPIFGGPEPDLNGGFMEGMMPKVEDVVFLGVMLQ